MFKRRKPDDPHVEQDTSLPAGWSLPDQVDTNDRPEAPSGPFDNGLGVPPFRPAPLQEVQTMSRQPFTTAPTPPQAMPAAGVRPALPPIRSPARDPAERRTLVVGRGISLQGTVQDAERLVVEGTIDGTLTARGSLIVRTTGKVLGTARCRRLQVEDGGQITGHIEMLTDQARSEPAPRTISEPAV